MDAKGRPTKLEDIISGDALVSQMGLKSDRSPLEVERQIFDNPDISNKLIKMVEAKVASSFDNNPQLMLGAVLMPKAMIMSMITALLICVDKAIMARAECDELREMADR